MGIGDRIRHFRNMRKMTQKKLGTDVGFSDNTADVRIVQYENGTRTPKEEMIKKIAVALDVSSYAIDVPNIDSGIRVLHTFFALEDLFGLRVVKHGGKVYLCFESCNDTMELMLEEWYEQSNKLRKGKISKEEYDDWRYHYPD